MASTSSGSTSSGGVAGHLGGGGGGRGDDGGALGHGLEHREAEALAQARVGDDRGGRVQRVEVGRRARTRGGGPPVAGRSVLQPSGPTSTSSASTVPEPGERLEQPGQVLAGLDRADEQHEGRSRPYVARTRSHVRRRPTGGASVPHGDDPEPRSASMPAATQSARVASDGQTTMAASARTRSRNRCEHRDAPRA